MEIKLFGLRGDGKTTLVDDDAPPELYELKWWVDYYGYAVCYFPGEHNFTRLHRLIVGAVHGESVDHINGDRLDNRRCNLRICTQHQNCCNQRPRTGIKSSKYKGVYWHKLGKKWMAYIKFSYKRYHLGLFNIEEDAARAYDVAAKNFFGEYAWLNFPTGT